MAGLRQLSDFLLRIRQKLDNLSLSDRRQIDAALISAFISSKRRLKATCDKADANQLREHLFALRQEVNQISTVSTNVDDLKEAIHDALCELTWKFPLNEISQNYILSPISGNPISLQNIVLSNGYIYNEREIKELARFTRNKPYFPQLGNISEYDVVAFRSSKITKKALMSLLVAPLLLWVEFLGGMGMLSLTQSAVMAATGLAMGATVVGIATGLVLLPIVATIAYFIGKVIYKAYKYSSTLEPDSSTSETRMLNVLGGKPSSERRNLKDDVLVPLLAPQAARNDVALPVVHQERQVEENAERRFSVY